MTETEKKETPKTTKTTKATKKPTKKEVDKIKKAYCYIGPNVPKSALKQNAVLIGTKEEIKSKFEEEIEKYPQIERLIVPVERLADAKGKVKATGNIINKYYQDLISTINAESKKEV